MAEQWDELGFEKADAFSNRLSLPVMHYKNSE
jgi:hypothetical protein